MEPNSSTPPVAAPPLPGHVMLQPDEHVITTIKKHPIGLVFIYLQVIGAFGAITALAAILIPSFLDSLSGETFTALTLMSVLLLTLMVFILTLVTTIYRGNRLTLTDKAVIQTLQTGPFQQKVSRLAMADIEDVTTEQKGILPTIFNYGTLHIETSGELKNFAFTYTPDSSKYATQVIEARHSASNSNND